MVLENAFQVLEVVVKVDGWVIVCRALKTMSAFSCSVCSLSEINSSPSLLDVFLRPKQNLSTSGGGPRQLFFFS